MGHDEADVLRSVRPLGVKNADVRLKLAYKQSENRDIAKNHKIKLIFLKINECVGSFL